MPRSEAPATSAYHCGSLENRINNYLEHRDAAVSVAVEDVGSKLEYDVNASRRQVTASIVKVELLETWLHRHNGVPKSSTADRAKRMIEQSNNDDAEWFWEHIGRASGLRDFDSTLGLTSTEPAAGHAPGYAWGRTLTTPSDQLRVLAVLTTRGPILTTKQRDYVIHLMRHVDSGQGWGVSTGTHGGYIALKNGWLELHGSNGWVVNSIGDIAFPHRRYQIAVTSRGSSTFARGIATVDGVSKRVGTYLLNCQPRHGVPTHTLRPTVTPVDDSGALLSGYTINHRYAEATCSNESTETGTAYRCYTPESKQGFYDPCWVASDSNFVDCLDHPWTRKVTQLHVTRGYTHGKSSPAKHAWGLRLAPGQKCLFDPQAIETTHHHEVHYYCDHKVAVAGSLRHGKPFWKAHAYRWVHPHGGSGHYASLGLVKVEVAWKGAPSATAAS